MQYQFNAPMTCSNVNYIPLESPLLDFGSGAFTVETWVGGGMRTAPYANIFNTGGSNNANTFHLMVESGVPKCRMGAHGAVIATGPSVVGDEPTHLACVRVPGTNVVTMYTNGVGGSPITSTVAFTVLATTNIGTNPSVCPIGSIPVVQACVGCSFYAFRATKGTALYAADFTPSTDISSCAAGTNCFLPTWPAQTCTGSYSCVTN